MRHFVNTAALVALAMHVAVANHHIGTDGKRHFDQHVVFRLTPSTEEQLTFLKGLAESVNPDIDFWSRPAGLNHTVDIMVSPEFKKEFIAKLDELGIPRKETIHDVEKIVKESSSDDTNDELALRNEASFFSKYHQLSMIYGYLHALASINSSRASIMDIGKTSEGRDMKLIKIGNPPSSEKPVIWIDGGIHAREWIAPATVLYMATQLMERADYDADVNYLLDTFEWYILPVANPDGYEFSHTKDRMWRKTRSRTNSLAGCRGVDPNRNFGFHWNEGGASTSPCSEIYAGPQAFSEPETKAIANMVLSRKNRMELYAAVHAYSQMWLTPWGWTKALPKSYSKHESLGKVAVRALTAVHGTKYVVGSSTNILYIATGGADDWALGVAEVPYAYTVELRDEGRYGFALPPKQIIPTGEETWEGFKAMALELAQELKGKRSGKGRSG